MLCKVAGFAPIASPHHSVGIAKATRRAGVPVAALDFDHRVGVWQVEIDHPTIDRVLGNEGDGLSRECFRHSAFGLRLATRPNQGNPRHALDRGVSDPTAHSVSMDDALVTDLSAGESLPAFFGCQRSDLGENACRHLCSHFGGVDATLVRRASPLNGLGRLFPARKAVRGVSSAKLLRGHQRIRRLASSRDVGARFSRSGLTAIAFSNLPLRFFTVAVSSRPSSPHSSTSSMSYASSIAQEEA